MRRKPIALVIGTLLAVGAVTTVTAFDFSGSEGPTVVIAEGDLLLPAETPSDWATFSDHLVIATVVSERELSPSSDEVKANEGLIPRVIRLRIDQVLWARAGAPIAPGAFETELDGWVFRGDKRTPLRLRGEPMMEVGKQFVLPIVYFSVTNTMPDAGWSTFSPDSIIPYQDGTLGKGAVIPARDGAHATGVVRAKFADRSAAQLADELAATSPDPAAADAMDLPPDVRAQRVWQQ